jgi:hypothetical protein
MMPSFEGRKLMFSEKEVPKENKQSTLSTPIEDDIVMEMPEDEASNLGPVQMIKLMLSGQYTYITYMIMSTTCFFFWLSPNFHKLKSFFKSDNNSSMRRIDHSNDYYSRLNGRNMMTRT